MWLVAGGHAGVCSWLCSQRCDPAKRDIEGTTAYFQAICGGGKEFPQQLLPSLFFGQPHLVHQFFEDTTDDSGLTLWHVGAMTDAVPALQWMVEHTESGLEPLLDASHSNPLLQATLGGHMQAVAFLLSVKADPGQFTPGSPRDWAAALRLSELEHAFWAHRDEVADAGWAARWNAYRWAAEH